jgi:hypothetical protein
MRHHLLYTTACAALLTAAPAGAQAVTTIEITRPSAAKTAPPPADAMVARLMSFDRNHDGLVSRDELPERMQPILARVEVFTTGDALDEPEIRRLAENPIARPQVFVFSAGHYGFGEDNGFDTRLHIETAIEDLRLASDTREKAIAIGHQFADAAAAGARTDLMAALTPLLTDEQMDKVTAAFDRKLPLSAPGFAGDLSQVQSFVAAVRLEEHRVRQAQVARLIGSFGLDADRTAVAGAAMTRFLARDRLTDDERSALVDQMDGLLSGQERMDLRAALERRPIVKQGVVKIAATF